MPPSPQSKAQSPKSCSQRLGRTSNDDPRNALI
eukprot:CAMPEP_0184313228 /NCGR_PEP_ID=MMETSP1049-20130417/60607_1 /TAXON_ID=77928 /ORGANISM="Proteomonas sulcata, Strain CCMP704" /LENGTH=32 /DNA_ID= /DNA_START= /DNA_END= /DNA_ORIENTATION=